MRKKKLFEQTSKNYLHNDDMKIFVCSLKRKNF